MRKLSLYVHSLRYLKPVQISSRLTRVVRQRLFQPFKAYRRRYQRPPAVQHPLRSLLFPEPIHVPAAYQDFATNTFTFLNKRARLGSPINWFPAAESQLWKYNLHYFDYVAALGERYVQEGDEQAYQTFRRLVDEWIAACPVATALAWDPYPSSLRICNWIKACRWFEPALRDDVSFAARLANSIHAQTRFLEENLEYHLLGNHLIENGRALLYAGLFFAGRDAERWRKKGEQILWDELDRQFLADGGHEERSPMYHQMMLHLYQEVVAVLNGASAALPAGVSQKIGAMADWNAEMRHPDGEIALLNDAAFQVAAPPLPPHKRAPVAADGLRAMAASGYFVFRDQAARNYLVFDGGPLGPDHQPGHGHCDTLSYELSINGLRFVVDAGVSDYYGDLNWRLYYRSTRAHNTVVVDGVDQSEVWDRFRVARRAHPIDVRWEDRGAPLRYVYAGHSGYGRLPGNVFHHRWLCWIDRRFWLVCDRISGRGRRQVESLIHFHPEVEILRTPGPAGATQNGLVRRGPTELQIAIWGAQNVVPYSGELAPLQGWYSPEFGLQCKNRVWGLVYDGEAPIWLGYLLWPHRKTVAVSALPRDAEHCEINIRGDDAHYRVICTSGGVTVENLT